MYALAVYELSEAIASGTRTPTGDLVARPDDAPRD
jgi:hypothetical protein